MHYAKISWLIAVSLLLSACGNESAPGSNYGVFLSLEGNEAVNASEGYETIVIDAQYLSAEEIAAMHERGQQVYSYLNIGSLENFRPYYEQYKQLERKPYEDWEEESWIDVADGQWQELITTTVARQLLDKGIDGFWVDNVDVYSHFPTDETYNAVETILTSINSHHKPVIINSGNEFVERYLEHNGHVKEILTGVNQETVFSSIDFDTATFGTQTADEHAYYLDYLNTIDELGHEIYLLEYTTDSNLMQKIEKYADARRWNYYISSSIELR